MGILDRIFGSKYGAAATTAERATLVKDLEEKYRGFSDAELQDVLRHGNQYVDVALAAARDEVTRRAAAAAEAPPSASQPPADSMSVNAKAVPSPSDAAQMLGEAAAEAPFEMTSDVLAGGAAILAEAVLATGGVTRDEARMLSVVAMQAARTAAKVAGHSQQITERIVNQVATAAAIGALIGQGCYQHGERDAAKKASRMVLEQLKKI